MGKISQNEFAKVCESFGSNAREYISKPIEDESYLKLLEKRIQSFSVGEFPIPMILDKEKVFDFGGNEANESVISAIIDLDQSKSLVEYLSKRLSYQVNSENTAATFVLQKTFDFRKSRKFRAPALAIKQYAIIMNHEKSKKSVAVHVLNNVGLHVIYHRRILSDDRKEFGEKINRFIAPRSSKFVGLYNRVAVIKDDRWHSCMYETERMLASKGLMYEIINLDEDNIQRYEAPATSPSPRIFQRFNGGSVDIPMGIVEIRGGSDDGSSGLGITGTPSGDGGGNPGGSLQWGPPQTAGLPGCQGWGTQDGCQGCCIAWETAALAVIAGGVVACCLASLGIGCGGCIAIGVGLATPISIDFGRCMSNCKQQYWNDTTP